MISGADAPSARWINAMTASFLLARFAVATGAAAFPGFAGAVLFAGRAARRATFFVDLVCFFVMLIRAPFRPTIHHSGAAANQLPTIGARQVVGARRRLAWGKTARWSHSR